MKGRDFKGKPFVEVPYLRVANVQDGYLDLSEMKNIKAAKEDVEALRLEKYDVLMTEGGDADKLGRGALWRNEIDNCIHQNHIFRVRLDQGIVLPLYFHQLLLTAFAKDYFFRAAKKTSNLATINMTQLKSFTVHIPPLSLQSRFSITVQKHERLRGMQVESLRQAEVLYSTLLEQAFGED